METTLKLKLLRAAYLAALEFDYCPEEDEVEDVQSLVDTDLTVTRLKEALIENSGRRPDEIANEICDTIKELK